MEEPSPKSRAPEGETSFTRYEVFVVAILAFLQFTIILDFMILSPLGAFVMPDLEISPSQFGMVVSGYAFSAGLAGFLASGFADRFDRKKLLMFFYVGFIFGTSLCAFAYSYWTLLLARIITGLFGGVIGSITLAIMADLFPYHRRGRVVGFIQSAFAVAQVLGLPFGLFLANHWGWNASFIVIVFVATLVGVLIVVYMKPINAHLLDKSANQNAMQHIRRTISKPFHLLAFLTSGLMVTGGFMIMPFSSAFSVNNLGIKIDQLPLLYLLTGISSILVGPTVGKLSDRFGNYRIFTCGSFLTIVMVIIYTNLGVTPLSLVILINALLFAGVFSRMIPSQALMSAIPEPSYRGAFMSVNASMQQMAGGLAAMIAGFIVTEEASGRLTNYETIGYVVAVASFVTIGSMFFINRQISGKLVANKTKIQSDV